MYNHNPTNYCCESIDPTMLQCRGAEDIASSRLFAREKKHEVSPRTFHHHQEPSKQPPSQFSRVVDILSNLWAFRTFMLSWFIPEIREIDWIISIQISNEISNDWTTVSRSAVRIISAEFLRFRDSRNWYYWETIFIWGQIVDNALPFMLKWRAFNITPLCLRWVLGMRKRG